jgi:pimeloyl-ACP methyl ester carboxylesterase
MKKQQLLHYEEQGHGPVVVLLHGYLASSRYWQRVSDDLARDHRVIAFDLLGFGKSPKPARSSYDYETQIASINLTLDYLGITEPFTLVGHSMGSLIALRYAKNHPKQVQKLILTNMPLFMSYKEAKDSILLGNKFYYVAMRPGLHALLWPVFKTAIRLRLTPNKAGEGAAARRKYLFQSTGISRLRSLRNIIYSAKIEADLAALNVTTIMVTGIHDRTEYIKNLASIQMHKHIRSISVAGGHHLPLTKPELVSQLV